MTDARAAEALFLLVALTLPLSALTARVGSRGRMVRLALVWAAIFLVAALVAGAFSSSSRLLALHNTYYQTGRLA